MRPGADKRAIGHATGWWTDGRMEAAIFLGAVGARLSPEIVAHVAKKLKFALP